MAVRSTAARRPLTRGRRGSAERVRYALAELQSCPQRRHQRTKRCQRRGKRVSFCGAMKTKKKKKGVQYIPGAADDGLGYFPVITCEVTRGRETQVLWVVHHQRRQV